MGYEKRKLFLRGQQLLKQTCLPMENTMGYEREVISRMAGYVPGKQPKIADIIKLNTNENPFAPAQAVMAALRDIDPESLRRYPSPLADRFREVAAKTHHVQPENIVAVNGGDELLRLSLTTFADPGRPIGILDPSYSLYPVLAEIHGCEVIALSASKDWSLPTNFAEQMNRAGVQLTIVVNPHAPSGHLVSADEVASLAGALDGVLLLDEAYVNFVDPELNHDTVALVNRYDNLLLLRSLSKGYSLAGLRFGYGIGADSLVEPIRTKTADSYPTDAIAQQLAICALENLDKAAQTWEIVREERAKMRVALTELGLDAPPTQSNFLLVSVPGGSSQAASIYRKLEERGILVRYFEHPRLEDKLRISIGTPHQNQHLLDELRDILG